MISFEIEEEQAIVRDMAARIALEVLRPAAKAADADSRFDVGVLDQLWALGLHAAQLEERDPVTNAIALEELSSGDVTAAAALAATMAFFQAIADQGSPKQRKWAQEAAGGARFTPTALAISEPGVASDIRRPRTAATPDASGGYRLDGVKALVPLASSCSHLLVTAQVGDRVEAFIVPTDRPGVSVAQAPGTLGLRALNLADVTLAGVAVSAGDRLGEPGAGFDLERVIACSRTATTAMLGGLSRAVYDYAVPYTKERVAHGSPIARKQSVAFRFADMHIEIEAMRWMAWRAASELASGDKSASTSARRAFVYAGEQGMWISDEGVQLFGGHGFVRSHPVEMWYRDARTLSVLEVLGGV